MVFHDFRLVISFMDVQYYEFDTVDYYTQTWREDWDTSEVFDSLLSLSECKPNAELNWKKNVSGEKLRKKCSLICLAGALDLTKYDLHQYEV